MFAVIAIRAFKTKALASSYRAFAITVPICLFIFDFGAVSFNAPHNLIMLMLACKCLTFDSTDEIRENIYDTTRKHFARFFQKRTSSSSK